MDKNKENSSTAEAIEEISAELSSYLGSIRDDADVPFLPKTYSPKKISKLSFNYFTEQYSAKKIAFIDGGNAEIITSSNFSVSFVRVCSLIFKGKKTISTKRYSFFIFASIISKGEKLYFKLRQIPVSGRLDNISIQDETLFSYDDIFNNLSSRTLSSAFSLVIGQLRKAAELSLAQNIVDKLSSGDIIMLDGTLEAKSDFEYGFFSRLFQKAEKSNILITALSKTTSLLTRKGNSLPALLGKIAEKGRKWYYFPIAEVKNPLHHADIFLVKLHERSDHIFRFEIPKNNEIVDIRKLFGFISSYSKDISFLGYPYGLIKADMLARISNSEKEYLRTIFLPKLGKTNDLVLPYLSSVNAHTILDKMSF